MSIDSEKVTPAPKKNNLKIPRPELNMSPEKITPTMTDLYELLLDYSNEVPVDRIVHSDDPLYKVRRGYWACVYDAMYIINNIENGTDEQKEIREEYKKLVKEVWQDKKPTLYDEREKEYVTPVTEDEINKSDTLLCRFLGINYDEYLAYKNQSTD